MNIKWLVVVSSVLVLIACEKVSTYTINHVDRTDLSISAHHETLIHNLVSQLQSHDIEAIKHNITPEFHQRLLAEPHYLDQISSVLPQNFKLSKKQLYSTSERILDKQDQSLEVIYKLNFPDDLFFLKITLLTEKNKSLIDDIEVNKVQRANET